MKIIVCGPPHSGKSVFISNLVKLLPSGYYVRINANGDGEGTWSNNPDQDEVRATRIKGTNSEEDFKRWVKQIECANQDIVLVDIGGRLQDDKAPLFEACDSFIIVSNSDEMIEEWIKFGTKHGCSCIGTVLSGLGDLHESIISYEPFVRGTMSGLERGHNIDGSKLLRAIADSIVSLSDFKGYEKQSDSGVIDMYDLGIKLGMSRHWKTNSGVEVHNVWYQPEKAISIHDYMTTFYHRGENYRIYGARALWASCLIASCLSNDDATNIEVYGITTKSYIPVSKVRVGSEIKGDISVTVKEGSDYTLVSVVLPTLFNPKDLKDVVLPSIDTNKKLLLSGKIPSWVAISIILSYENDEKYIHAPGIGYIKVEDKKFNKYGDIISITEKS